MALEDLRTRIDGIDEAIVRLLNERYSLVKQIGEWKRQTAGAAYVPERESQLLKRLCALNEGPMQDDTLRAIYREIMSGALALEQPVKVAFLGPVATFTHQAALGKFGNSVKYMPQQTVADIFEAVERDSVSYGVVPVENSTEGAVTHTLDMFTDTNLVICAEIYMLIHHNLLCRCGMDELTVLYSHPQVFGQCRKWLRQNLPQVPCVEVSSTTQAAARCAEEPTAGALASALAAEHYRLPIRAENIEDFSENITRFLVLGKQQPEATGDDKTSLQFVIRDRVGALHDSLLPFGKHDVNLTFIESRPSRRKNWEYFFFVDFAGHLSDAPVREALEELREHCQFVKIMGSYPRAGAPV